MSLAKNVLKLIQRLTLVSNPSQTTPPNSLKSERKVSTLVSTSFELGRLKECQN